MLISEFCLLNSIHLEHTEMIILECVVVKFILGGKIERGFEDVERISTGLKS